ncbi:VirD4-like conjugal transfer protein, CD1115 family [Desulfofalx alkaliphila]|uniref:VirD4-like conjugal transfer protein, CD1115 family n=1 Tax=Desulfofalx alkaliphila TaxID=105483 RepID=UPI001EE3CF88|nr:type IV secretory system conjugative DNA transfer family protein [Desulfofalx alkaliphila]
MGDKSLELFNRGSEQIINQIPEGRFKDWVNNHRGLAFGLASLPVVLPAGFILDVWALGKVAGSIYDLGVYLKSLSIFATPEQKAAAADKIKMGNYITNNTWAVTKVWLTGTYEPGMPVKELERIKKIWQWGNITLMAGIPWAWWKLQWGIPKHSATKVHGLKVVDNAAFGTNRWAGLKDLKNFCEFGPPVPLEKNKSNHAKFPGGNLIGEVEKKIVRVNFEKVSDDTPKTAPHVLAYGGTGAGKSYSFVSGNIISGVSDGQSLVMIDPKGELFRTFANWLKKLGYQVRVLNFMTPEHSHRWNPVIECMDDAEISEMIDTLSKNATSGSESYFMLKGMELMEAFIGLLKGDFPTEQQHMRSLMTLASWPEEKLDARFKTAFETDKISPIIYERWRGVVKKNYEYAVSNLTAVLKNLTTAPLAAMMSEQEIDLSEIGKKKTALFLIIPTGGEGVYLKPILAMFYKFLFKRLDKLAFTSPGERLPVPVRNVWDEMANVGVIPGLPEVISTARSKGIHVQMILQTPTQLESLYGRDDAKTITGNCPTVMMIGIAPADRDLAKMFSEILGTAAVEAYTEREDRTVPGKHWFEFSKKTKTVIERPLMTMSEIFKIDPRYCIALLQWSNPVYLKKVGWTKLPQAKDIRRCGMLSVKEYVPARDFNICLPEDDSATSSATKTSLAFTTDLIQDQETAPNKANLEEPLPSEKNKIIFLSNSPNNHEPNQGSPDDKQTKKDAQDIKPEEEIEQTEINLEQPNEDLTKYQEEFSDVIPEDFSEQLTENPKGAFFIPEFTETFEENYLGGGEEGTEITEKVKTTNSSW